MASRSADSPGCPRVKVSKQFIVDGSGATASMILIIDHSCPLAKFLLWCKCRDVEEWRKCTGSRQVALVSPGYGFEVMKHLKATADAGVDSYVDEFLACSSRLSEKHRHPLVGQLFGDKSNGPVSADSSGVPPVVPGAPSSASELKCTSGHGTATSASGVVIDIHKYACYSSGTAAACSRASSSADVAPTVPSGHTSTHQNLNNHITDFLESMIQVYAGKGDVSARCNWWFILRSFFTAVNL
jgi:hypothetical protein